MSTVQDQDYAAARPPLGERHGGHNWKFTGQRGRCRDYACADAGCCAVHIEVTAGGRLDCPFHGPQAMSPCSSCEMTPWRYGSDWGRCQYVDANAYGDKLRCALYTGHAYAHQFTCGSIYPETGEVRCGLPYGHPGDMHADRNGEKIWLDDLIGPVDRKPHVRGIEPV